MTVLGLLEALTFAFTINHDGHFLDHVIQQTQT